LSDTKDSLRNTLKKLVRFPESRGSSKRSLDMFETVSRRLRMKLKSINTEK